MEELIGGGRSSARLHGSAAPPGIPSGNKLKLNKKAVAKSNSLFCFSPPSLWLIQGGAFFHFHITKLGPIVSNGHEKGKAGIGRQMIWGRRIRPPPWVFARKKAPQSGTPFRTVIGQKPRTVLGRGHGPADSALTVCSYGSKRSARMRDSSCPVTNRGRELTPRSARAKRAAHTRDSSRPATDLTSPETSGTRG